MMLHKTLGRVVYPAFLNLVWRLPRREKTLYLTFDDGPTPAVTRDVLQILASYRVPAIFFLSGSAIYQNRHRLKSLDYQENQIGNHGYFHRPLTDWRAKNIHSELIFTDRLIDTFFGVKNHLFRPPFGMFGPGLLNSLNRLKKSMMLWSLMSNDFKWPVQRVIDHLRKNVQPGDIVVFHDSEKSGSTVLCVLPEFIEHCLEHGYRFLVL